MTQISAIVIRERCQVRIQEVRNAIKAAQTEFPESGGHKLISGLHFEETTNTIGTKKLRLLMTDCHGLQVIYVIKVQNGTAK